VSLCRIKGHVVAPIGLRAGVFRCNMIADSGRGVAVWRLKKSIDANNVTVTCVMLCSSSLESGHGSILLPVLPAVVRCIEMAEGRSRWYWALDWSVCTSRAQPAFEIFWKM